MRQLIYALRFRGKAWRVDPDGDVLSTLVSAPGSVFASRIGPEGLSGSLDPATGDEAILRSEWVFTGPTTFQETGTIAFGPGGHRLRFSTFGSAYLGPAADDAHRHGTTVRCVDGGEGQFAGAHGLIASALVVDAAGEITDHQIGVIYVQ